MVTIYFVTIIVLMVIFIRSYYKYSDLISNRVILLLVCLAVIPIFNTAWLAVSIYQGVAMYIKEESLTKSERRRRMEGLLEQLENAIDLVILRFRK